VVKKTITYTSPFTDELVSEDHYFHISKADLIEMELEEHATTYEKDGETLTGMQAHLQKIVDSKEAPAVLAEFKAILRRAYGKKVGERFVKSEAIWQEFEGTEAYSELIFQLLTNADELGTFIANIIPHNLEAIAAEIAARGDAEAAGQSGSTPPEEVVDPTGFTKGDTPQVLTQAQMREMDAAELQAGLADGRYKLS
jgi:hypothetical protein